MIRYFVGLCFYVVIVFAIFCSLLGTEMGFFAVGALLVTVALVEAFVAIDDIRSDSSDWWDY